MVKKQIDSRIRTVIENNVEKNHRTFFVIVGDKGRDQVVNLHHILTRSAIKAKPSVLWCYKKELGFSTHVKKRMKQKKKLIKLGVKNADDENPFDTFVSSTNIRYSYYKDTHKILGQTVGMLILQDFEAITPNLLARTIETVEGGGLVILLLNTMTSLKQLYAMSMDCHSRFRTESHQDITPRFNERFLLSLGACANCLVMDDELNILPISSHSRKIKAVQKQDEDERALELKNLKDSLQGTKIVHELVKLAKTKNQAKALMMFIEAISELTLRSTMTLTAARGRGKSAALGISIAAAIAFGYSNILITAPSPENLGTVFEFTIKALKALEYKDHMDYEVIESTNPAFNHAIIRINIFKSHRQTVQYIQPQDYQKLGQCELLVIDEAAAIPLPWIKKLMGPYLIFMSSTINGYEGTGRSLSLKLIKQLKEQASQETGSSGRVVKEVVLNEAIRYAENDPIEKWLNNLLCLDASTVPKISSGCPLPNDCELYYVSRDTLFSFHEGSEKFLQRLVALFVASHYKNSPDDLLLMADAPAHHLFVLLGPVDPKSNQLPEILCAVQVSLEGEISRKNSKVQLATSDSPSGDLIPWTVSQQFRDSDFAMLSGARIVRIATHPDYQRMGYGTKVLNVLADYYQGNIISVNEAEEEQTGIKKKTVRETNLKEETVEPRADLPPLLVQLQDRKPERLHYLGTSFGFTQDLYKYWSKSGFESVYMRQVANDITGEHSCIMLKTLKSDDLEISCDDKWLKEYHLDFKRRFISLLSYQFCHIPSSVALSILHPLEKSEPISSSEIDAFFLAHDLERLTAYANHQLDFHAIMDLLPSVAKLWFLGKFPFNLSPSQNVILLGAGLQKKQLDDIVTELNSSPFNQILALFNKAIIKFSKHLNQVKTKDVTNRLIVPESKQAKKMKPLEKDLEEELEEGAQEVRDKLKQKQEKFLKELDSQYLVGETDDAWEKALSNETGVINSISVKSNKRKKSDTEDKKTQKGGPQKKKQKTNNNNNKTKNNNKKQKKFKK